MSWQLQEAKQKFSELVDVSLRDGPQLVTKRGEEAVFVISADEYHRLASGKQSFKEFLLSGPPIDELEIYRSTDTGRDLDLS